MNAPSQYSGDPCRKTDVVRRLICARPAAHDQINGEVSPVLFVGQTIKADTHDRGLAELRFERGSEALNKLDAPAFGELRRALDAIKVTPAISITKPVGAAED
jgi:hypothetical protein